MVITGNNAANNIFGSNDADTIRGLDGDDLIYGDDGDDHIRGDGGSDEIYGGRGDDSVVYDLADITGTGSVDGGEGEDTILSAGAATVVVDNLGNMSNIEVIDLNDFAVNLVDDGAVDGEIDPVDVHKVTDSRDNLKIEGELGDSVDLDLTSFAFTGFVDGYMTYSGVYDGHDVTVEVDPDVTVF